MNVSSAQPGSSPQGTARSDRTPAGIIMKRFGASQDSRKAPHPSYNDEWAAGFKARHPHDGSSVGAQEPELLPCVWNIPHG